MKPFNQSRLQATLSYFYSPFVKHPWAKGIGVFLVAFSVVSQISRHVTFVYSQTSSLPYHLFLNLKRVTPKRGDYACFNSSWYGGRVIKKVVGKAGDVLSYDQDRNLWLEYPPISDPSGKARLKIGNPKKESIDGRLLTPLKPGVIPEGKVFVMGEHERSFDSRYEELGLVPEEDLQGRLIALA